MAVVGRGIMLAGASRLTGLRADPYMAFNFVVEIEGLLVGGFSECTGLQVETEVEEYAEGGLNEYTHHFRGRTKYPPLVLKHGLSMLDDLWFWQQDVTQGKFQRRNGTIYFLNSMQIPVTWWNFKNAFPVKWIGPELRAETNSVAFESVELVHQGLSRPAGLVRRVKSLF